MINQVLQSALTLYLPYFAPIIFILSAVVVADRLRIMMTDSFDLSKKRRTA